MRAIGIERFEFITKATYAYEHLKQEIIDGALAPGEKLVVNSISKRYHMSAMPVREALLRLEQDGLVQSSPHRGACVHRCDYNQFYALIQVSVALETMACRLAAVLIDDGAMAQLEGFLRGMESAAQCGDISTYLVLNEEFHMGIYRASGNKELFELIHTTHRRTYPYTSIALHTRGRVAHSMEEHRHVPCSAAGILPPVSGLSGGVPLPPGGRPEQVLPIQLFRRILRHGYGGHPGLDPGLPGEDEGHLSKKSPRPRLNRSSKNGQ